MSDYDQSLFPQACKRLPLPHLMTKIGDGEFTTKGAPCPFCKAKGGKWGVFKDANGHYRFKCHKNGCVANENDIGHNEVAYLALRRDCDVKQAALEFLHLAVPDLLEEQKKRRGTDKAAAPKPKEPVASPPTAEEPTSRPPATEPEPPANVIPIFGGPPGGGDGAQTPPPRKPRPNPWDALWRKLVLNASDRAALKNKRGYSDDTINALGFRTNDHSNRVHLESLLKDFSIGDLVSEGIFVRDRTTGKTKPNAQFCGYGRTGRKDENGDEIWDWTKPTIIPYLTENRAAFYLRPHKGGIKRPDDADEDEWPGGHVYCPYLIAGLEGRFDGLLVLTEGEFKAAALFQCGIPAIAIPGVTFVRKQAFKWELLNLLKRFRVTDVVICFDNEVRDDPKFKDRYQPNPWKRWDIQMWAEYIAIDLHQEHFGAIGGRVRLGWLPDELREDGKADFDSVLSMFVRKHGVEEGTKVARRVFTQVIDEARPQNQYRELFPSESRRIIECRLKRLFYKPLVPAGGDKEAKLATRLQTVDRELAAAFRSVVGCYYKREIEKTTFGADLKMAKELKAKVAEMREAGVNGDELRKVKLAETAAWERVKGTPVPISDFTLTCDFKLHTTEGKAVRLVRIRNRNDTGKNEARLVRLSGSEMGRLANFRTWGYDTGRAVWKGSERDLQNLAEDMDHHSYFRDIHEVNYYGFHRDSGLWFFGDCAFAPDGEMIKADDNNIFWYGGLGYQIDETIPERGTHFVQKSPLMLAPHGAKPREISAATIFAQMVDDIYDTVGGYDAWLGIGLMLAYAAAQELLTLGGHPSSWWFGKMSGGKTTIIRWLMRVWGFPHLEGVRISAGTTHVGMNRFLAQYSCLPVWFDEYRTRQIDEEKESVLRGAFDRNSGAKGMADNTNRTRSATIYTTPVVSGESSSSDAATRSRYGHINVNDQRRIGDGATRYRRVQEECKHYYAIGRFIMENRKKFTETLLGILSDWTQNEEIRRRIVNERVRFTHGVGYAAFTAAAELLEYDYSSGKSPADFFQFLLGHAEQALSDVISETFLTQFWRAIISGLQRGRVKKRFFAIKHVIAEADGRIREANEGDAESFKVCYIAHHPVYDDYAESLRSRGDAPPLDVEDLRREMSKEPYWIAAPKDTRVHRITLDGHRTSCWVINVEKDREGSFPFAEELTDAITAAGE